MIFKPFSIACFSCTDFCQACDAALCSFNSLPLRNLLRDQMSVESLQCPIVVMWRCNVLTSLQWLLSRPILGTGLWATFCSNVPQREVSPLLQTRGCMLVQAYSGGQDGRRKTNSVVQQLAALLSLRIEIKQQPLEFPPPKNRFRCLLTKLEEILLHRSQPGCSLVCVLLSRSITASVPCPLFLSPCPTYLLIGGAHTHRHAHTDTHKLEKNWKCTPSWAPPRWGDS